MSADIPIDIPTGGITAHFQGHRLDRGLAASSMPGPAAYLAFCECGVKFYAYNRPEARAAWRAHVVTA